MQFISDPGHAWLRVSLKELFESGVAHKISRYSYLENEYVYLEEDCDATIFLQAIGMTENNFSEARSQGDSFIRSFCRYSLDTAAKLLVQYYYS